MRKFKNEDEMGFIAKMTAIKLEGIFNMYKDNCTPAEMVVAILLAFHKLYEVNFDSDDIDGSSVISFTYILNSLAIDYLLYKEVKDE